MIEIEKQIINKDFLCKEYSDNKKSIMKICKEFNLPSTAVYNKLIEFKIEIRKSKKFQIPKDILYTEYVENKKTIDQISEIFGCSRPVIRRLMISYNIETNVGKNNNVISIITKELLKKLYIKDDLSIKNIAKKLKMTERYIGLKLKEHQIPRKRAEKIYCVDIDLTGKIFGKLTVIALKDKLWLCQCDCGAECLVLTRKLMAKHRSCGCARASNSDWKILPPYIFNKIIYGAKIRDLEFNITREFAENLFLTQNKKCALSGIELCFKRKIEQEQSTASLDRIDSKKGYIEDNIQWVHKKINIIKTNSENEEFINWCKLVADFNK